jgi:hypothetical protein
LWADSIEEIWRPQGGKISILRELSGVHTITVDRVLQEITQLVD